MRMVSFSNNPTNSATKDVRYDRQLRLWGDGGQFALEKAKICLLNASVTGAEILKSLVLPGVGSFTVIDHRKVTQMEILTNFFLDPSQLGKNLAEAVCSHVKELNSDVVGRFLVKNVDTFVENNGDKSFLDQFDLVIGTRLWEKHYLEIGNYLFDKQIPFIICETYGLMGYLRIITREHFIFDAHPDFKAHNFQLDKPFPTFKQFCDAVNLPNLTHEKHSHVPYLVLLYKAIEKWKTAENGKMFPSTYADKTKLKSILISMRMPDEKGNLDEENIHEAITAVGSSVVPSTVPSILKNLFADPRIENEKHCRKHHFWLMCKALKTFIIEENSGLMPLRGDLPDMMSDSDSYVQLQNIYYEEADKNIKRVYEIVQEIANQHDVDCSLFKSNCENGKIRQTFVSYSLPTFEQTRAFCKNAAFINVLDTRSLNQEYKIDVKDVETDAKTLHVSCEKMLDSDDYQNEKRSLDLYIIWRACQRFNTEKNRYPGTNGVPENLDKLDLISRIKNLHKYYDLPDEYVVDDALVEEMCRYGASEIHSVASFMGGLAAQESIKLITGQYVPLNNTFIFDANSGSGSAFEF